MSRHAPEASATGRAGGGAQPFPRSAETAAAAPEGGSGARPGPPSTPPPAPPALPGAPASPRRWADLPLTTSSAAPWPALRTTLRILREPFRGRSLGELLFGFIGFPIALVCALLLAALLFGSTLLSIAIVGVPILCGVILLGRPIGALHRGLARGLLGKDLPEARAVPAEARLPRLDRVGVRERRSVARHRVRRRASARVVRGSGIRVDADRARRHAPDQPDLGAHRPAHPRSTRTASPTKRPSRSATTTSTAGASRCSSRSPAWRWSSPRRGCCAAFCSSTCGSCASCSARPRRPPACRTSRSPAPSPWTTPAARLRRIERDLHDGAQARIVALAMHLSQAQENLDDDDEPVDVDKARTHVDSALGSAKLAIAESATSPAASTRPSSTTDSTRHSPR
ncbi:sensor domain-containing protein [Yinghuangia aomiensis]